MIDFSALAYELDRSSAMPLFVQLSNAIRNRIASGQIAPRLRLPPSRSLATDLNLSRSTITNAYEQLVAEGYIEGRRGSGFYSCPIGEIEFNSAPVTSQLDFRPTGPPIESRRRLHPGSPDMRLFPYRQWAQCVSRVARLTPKALISTDDSFGNIELRQSIARYLKDWRGLETSAEQILITAGSIDALEICVRTLTDSGDYVGLEDPGYQPLHNIVLNLGLRPYWLSTSYQGSEIPEIQPPESTPKLTILTPSHQFPLGGAMSPLKRREFLQWAEQTDSWIIEDDYDSEFRYAGSPIQALAGFDTTDRTIYVGTFSKIFSEGLRLGFLVAPVSLLTEFSNTLSQFGVKAASTSQAALSSFLDSGEFYRHLRRCRRIYADRRQFLIDLLQHRLGDVISFEDHAAGMQFLARLAPGYDDQQIVKAASEQSVFISALSSHYAQGDKQHGLLLGFCGFTEDEIESNISVIERIIRKL